MSTQGLFDRVLSPGPLIAAPHLCLKARHRDSSCRYCAEVCPCDAISLDTSLQIDFSKCGGCGACVNICPTDVFRLNGFSYQSLLRQLDENKLKQLACSRLADNENALRIPCLGYLDEAFLIGVALLDSAPLVINIGDCKKCEFWPGVRAGIKSLKRANQILSVFGIKKNLTVFYQKTDSLASLNNRRVYSRKEFFSHLGIGVRNRVEVAMESASESRSRTKVSLEPKIPQKRAHLLEQIQKLGQVVSERINTDNLPFSMLVINHRCNGCGMCATFCPTGALKINRFQERQVIDFDIQNCLTCALCRDICPEKAISFSSEISPSALFNKENKVLIEHREAFCRSCGQSYIASKTSNLCPVCGKSKSLEEALPGAGN